jgi:hypothetical protein
MGITVKAQTMSNFVPYILRHRKHIQEFAGLVKSFARGAKPIGLAGSGYGYDLSDRLDAHSYPL